MIAPIAGERSTPKACTQLTCSPASRRRLSSVSPRAATGPISVRPATIG